MGRHGRRETRAAADRPWTRWWATVRAWRGYRPSRLAMVCCVLLVGFVGLGVWWWMLQSGNDPIDADPVASQAQVLSSSPCGDGGPTTVRVTTADSTVTATLNGCGYSADQWIAVEYLRGHPTEVRLAGTSTAGPRGWVTRLLPFGILVAGAGTVIAGGLLLAERRRSRHGHAGGAVSVAHLRERIHRGRGTERGSGRGTGRAGGPAAGPGQEGAGESAAGPAWIRRDANAEESAGRTGATDAGGHWAADETDPRSLPGRPPGR